MCLQTIALTASDRKSRVNARRLGTGQAYAKMASMIRIILILALVLSATSAFAQPQAKGSLAVESAWARATPGNARDGAAYFRVVNNGSAPDRLIGVSTPVADKADPHETKTGDGIMRMRPLEQPAIAPGQTLEFKPGGAHVMLVGLKHPLKEGESFPLVLTFEKAGDVSVAVKVERAGAARPTVMDHGAMDHSGHGSTAK
jgi:copper(I)-binding protein